VINVPFSASYRTYSISMSEGIIWLIDCEENDTFFFTCHRFNTVRVMRERATSGLRRHATGLRRHPTGLRRYQQNFIYKTEYRWRIIFGAYSTVGTVPLTDFRYTRV